MNPENDQTAIWLEQKFDVPNSGHWVSEPVFGIPVSDTPSEETFPGLIVFELTPLEGIDDELERFVLLFHFFSTPVRLTPSSGNTALLTIARVCAMSFRYFQIIVTSYPQSSSSLGTISRKPPSLGMYTKWSASFLSFRISLS